MKKSIRSVLAVLLALLCLLSLAACKKTDANDPWKDAAYTKDTTFGEGAKTVAVDVVVGEHKITFTVKTDAETVGGALMEHGLIDGDQGEFGLYLKKVNGITADYDVDKSYWAFYVNGEYAMSGVDTTTVENGAEYSFKIEK